MTIEDSKKAIQIASDFYKSVIPHGIEDIRLEGIEMIDMPHTDENNKAKVYKITLSYPEEGGYIFADKSKRHLNSFIISDKFEFISMGVLNESD